MKFVFDERFKHRMIGCAVIISLAAIFAPAIMKKSNQRFDKEVGMRIELPPKPQLPQVAVTDKEKLFKTIKIAHVKLSNETAKKEPIQIAKIEKRIPLEALAGKVDKNFLAPIPVIKKVKTNKVEPVANSIKNTKQSLALAQKAKIDMPMPTKSTVKKPFQLALNQEIYSVQLASFASRENAQTLVNRLRSKGYTGKIVKVSGKKGVQFKVFVGRSNNKDQALKLKNQLASIVQLQGFVVSGVG